MKMMKRKHVYVMSDEKVNPWAKRSNTDDIATNEEMMIKKELADSKESVSL
jgi:hypothetical protein